VISASSQGLVTGLQGNCHIFVDFQSATVNIFDVDKKQGTPHLASQKTIFKRIFEDHKKGDIPASQMALAKVNYFLKDFNLEARVEVGKNGMIMFCVENATAVPA
jgi:hypothetical protein